jgi:hypothetical protein
MSAVAQRKIDESVGRWNRKYQEAIKTDGWVVYVWNRTRGSIRCTCTQPQASIHEINAEPVPLDPTELINEPEKAFDKLPQTDSRYSPQSSMTGFKVRGQKNDLSSLKDNQPIPPNPEPVQEGGQMDVLHSGQFDSVEPELDLNEAAKQRLKEISFLVNGGDKTPCGICLGTGYTDGYRFCSGKRIILDASEAAKYISEGVTVDTKQAPFRFQAQGVGTTLTWQYRMPAYYEDILAVRLWNDRKKVYGMEVHCRQVGTSTWFPCTRAQLLTYKGTETLLEFRVRCEQTNLDGVLTDFTHLEILMQQTRLPYAQFEQLDKNTNFEIVEALVTLNCEIEPIVGRLERESIVEMQKNGLVWKLTDVKNQQTANNQLFSYVLEIRLVQSSEPSYVLRVGKNYEQLYYPFRNLERVQGEVQTNVAEYK